MIKTKQISKEVVLFQYTEISSTIIDELLEFINSIPKVENSRYNDGTNILLSNIKLNIANNKYCSVTIGINYSGIVKDIELLPDTFYYFDKNELKSINDLKFLDV